jgi:hypothetical protein
MSNYDGNYIVIGVVEWSMSTSFATMACKRQNIFFPFTSCFCLFIYFPELLQGLLTTWLQIQKHIGIHSLDINFKTNVQGKQMYVGWHHTV